MIRRVLPGLLVAAAMLAALPASASAVETGLNLGPRTNGQNVDQVDRAGRAGADWLRIFVDWSSAEPAQGQVSSFYLNEFDARVARARAAGMKVLMVVTSAPSWASGSTNPNTPPTDPATYASFMGRIVDRYRGQVSAWEVWNEPDEAASWAPGADPAAYAALLKAAAPAIRAADPDATIVSGGLVGNDYRFLDEVYANGAAGTFDAVGVHTDTACLTSSPDDFYREPDNRIGRFSFTGYREVRRTIQARGDDAKIWMTELGWSTLRSTCQQGTSAGKKPSGVTEAKQAEYLTRAYRCLQRDPYVEVALWFSIQDVDASTTRYDHRLGLIDDRGGAKPAYRDFRTFAKADTKPTASCGVGVDSEAPKVQLLTPASGQQYLNEITISARATDNVKVRRMDLFADGQKVPGSQMGDRFRLSWNGAKRLGLGEHTLTVRAYDDAGNVGSSSVKVQHVDATTASVPTARLATTARRLGGRRVQLTGRVKANSPIAPRGRIRFFVQYRTKTGGWKTFSRYSGLASRTVKINATIRRAGVWRVRSQYDADAPYKDVTGATRSLGRFR